MPEPITVGVRAFRENMSRYIAEVQDGASLTIVSHGKPVAAVTAPVGAHGTALPRYGALKGKLWIADDFDDPDDDFIAAYEGGN